MNIIVCIKQVPDTETKLKLNSDGNGIDPTGMKWILNPYDEFAVEEALKLKEKFGTATVTVISLGPKTRVVDTLRTALAMGADTGVVIDSDGQQDSYVTAKALASVISQEESWNIIFTGKLAIDDNAGAVSQMLAEFLNIPHTNVVGKFSLAGDKISVERDADGGTRELIELSLPAVIGANKGLNLPRYASLPGIMKAKKKPIKELSLESLSLDKAAINKVKYINYQLPPEKPAVKMLSGASAQQVVELVALLRDEAKVL
jgi:electron transfer flavoprotein beta subunit